MRNRVLIYAEALDVAAEGAVWYARRVGAGEFAALHVAGPNTDTGIHARWFDFTGSESRLDVRPAGTDATKAVLGEIARLRDEADGIVTVVLPERIQPGLKRLRGRRAIAIKRHPREHSSYRSTISA